MASFSFLALCLYIVDFYFWYISFYGVYSIPLQYFNGSFVTASCLGAYSLSAWVGMLSKQI
jgi:hypothetical protein